MEPRIIGYCRVSGDGQHGNDQDGVPRQHRVIESWAKGASNELANGSKILV